MEAFQTLLVVLVIIGLVLYAFERLPVPLGAPAKAWITCIIALAGAAYLVQTFIL